MKAEEEARIKANAEAKQKAEEEAILKLEEESQLKSEEEAKEKTRLKAEEEARQKAEEEKRKAEIARMKAEEEAKLNAENEAKTTTTTFKTTILIEEITTIPTTTTTQNYPIIIEEVTIKPTTISTTTATTTTASSTTTSLRTTSTTITTDEVSPSSREVTGLSEEEIEKFNLAFNSCVDKHSKCLEYRGDETYCKDQFNVCSLEILSDAKLNDNEVQPFTYDANYENDLFACIQTYTTCTSSSGTSCMENYNSCTLNVLDTYHSDQQQTKDDIENVGAEDESDEDKDLGDEDVLVEEEVEGDYPTPSTGACSEFDVPKTYSSFSGRPVSNTGKFVCKLQ